MKKLPFLFLLALSGCSTAQQGRINAFMKSDAGQAIARVAFTTGSAAVNHFAATGKVDGKEIAQAALSGASAELRKAQTPGFAAAAAAVQTAARDAVHQGAGVPAVAQKVAPALAQAVADAVKNQHAPADLALEAAARGLDQAAAAGK